MRITASYLNCDTCSQGKGGKEVAAYKGETGRNAFDRGKEHLAFLDKKCEKESVLWLHALHHHQGREDVPYAMRVTGAYRDSLDRQVTEQVHITNFRGPVWMNRKSEMGGVRVDREQYRRWGPNN